MGCMASLLSMFTRLPARGGEPRSAAKCAYLLPSIAALEALIASIPLLFLGCCPLLAAVASYALHAYVTGGIHLDGLLDYADAALPGLRGGDALRVMKDPRRGAGALIVGVVHALLAVAALRVLLESLGGWRAAALLVAAYAACSAFMLFALLLLPPEPYGGLARIFRDALGEGVRPVAVCAQLLFYSLLGLFSPLALLGGLVASMLAWLAVLRDAYRRLGFATGDVAGACFEVCRAAFLLGAVIALRLA